VERVQFSCYKKGPPKQTPKKRTAQKHNGLKASWREWWKGVSPVSGRFGGVWLRGLEPRNYDAWIACHWLLLLFFWPCFLHIFLYPRFLLSPDWRLFHAFFFFCKLINFVLNWLYLYNLRYMRSVYIFGTIPLPILRSKILDFRSQVYLLHSIPNFIWCSHT
jgi:hypothetical protein